MQIISFDFLFIVLVIKILKTEKKIKNKKNGPKINLIQNLQSNTIYDNGLIFAIYNIIIFFFSLHIEII